MKELKGCLHLAGLAFFFLLILMGLAVIATGLGKMLAELEGELEEERSKEADLSSVSSVMIWAIGTEGSQRREFTAEIDEEGDVELGGVDLGDELEAEWEEMMRDLKERLEGVDKEVSWQDHPYRYSEDDLL